MVYTSKHVYAGSLPRSKKKKVKVMCVDAEGLDLENPIQWQNY
jgi:hypothetical protein